MTTDEAFKILEEIEILDDSMYQYNIKYLEALGMAIKALKQYGALQEIRQEIEIVCSLFAVDKIDRPSTDKEITAHVRLNMILDYIDEYIREIEGSDTE